MTALTLNPVRRRDVHQAVRFDGSSGHARSIIDWVHDAHGGEIWAGHMICISGICTIFFPVRSGIDVKVMQNWWVVQSGPTEFAAYSPDAFVSTFEVVK